MATPTPSLRRLNSARLSESSSSLSLFLPATFAARAQIKSRTMRGHGEEKKTFGFDAAETSRRAGGFDSRAENTREVGKVFACRANASDGLLPPGSVYSPTLR